MESEQVELVKKAKVMVLGGMFDVEIFSRTNGKGFALTRYRADDIIITDGLSAQDAFDRHSIALPLAIGSRISKRMAAGNELQR